MRGQVERGHALFVPGTHLVTNQVDASVRGTSAAVGSSTVLHIGSAAIRCRVRPLGARHVRLTLAEPLPLRVDDRAVVRDPGRAGSLAGLTVLDVRPPALTGRGTPSRCGADLTAVDTPAEMSAHLLAIGPQRSSDLVAMGLPIDRGKEVASDWRVAAEPWAALGAALVAAVTRCAGPDPLSVAAAASQLDLPDQALVAPLATAAGLRVRHGAPLACSGSDRGSCSPPERRRCVRAPGPICRARFRVTDGCAELATTRRTAVPLLELLDRTGRTRRLPDGRRVLVSPRPAPRA